MKNIFWSGSGDTPVGVIWTGICDEGLLAIQVGGDGQEFVQNLTTHHGKALTFSEDRTALVIQQIEAYLHGKRKTFDIPIYWNIMRPFQQKVLQVVSAIPYGETRGYGQIAAQIGIPRAPRAVGRANGTNPMPLVIPCHRLVGKDGSLRGYGGGEGIKTKAWLINMEKSHMLK